MQMDNNSCNIFILLLLSLCYFSCACTDPSIFGENCEYQIQNNCIVSVADQQKLLCINFNYADCADSIEAEILISISYEDSHYLVPIGEILEYPAAEWNSTTICQVVDNGRFCNGPTCEYCTSIVQASITNPDELTICATITANGELFPDQFCQTVSNIPMCSEGGYYYHQCNLPAVVWQPEYFFQFENLETEYFLDPATNCLMWNNQTIECYNVMVDNCSPNVQMTLSGIGFLPFTKSMRTNGVKSYCQVWAPEEDFCYNVLQISFNSTTNELTITYSLTFDFHSNTIIFDPITAIYEYPACGYNPDCSGIQHTEVPLTTFFPLVYVNETNNISNETHISQTIDHVSQTVDHVSQTVAQVSHTLDNGGIISNQTEQQQKPETPEGSNLYLLFLILGVVVVLVIGGIVGVAVFIYIRKRTKYEVFASEEMSEIGATKKELQSEDDLFTLEEEEPKEDKNVPDELNLSEEEDV